jgi:hypothetical protein
MTISLRSVRNAAAAAIGTGALAAAILFGGAPVAQAASPPAPGTSIAIAGLYGAPGIPTRGGHGGGGRGHGGDGWGHGGGGWGHGGGGWGHGGWGRGGDWDNGGGGWGWRPWWNWGW